MNAELKQYTSPADGLAPVYAQDPIEVVGAEGVWLHTRDGRKVLDLYGGHAVASLGYGHKGWTEALGRQAAQMNFQTNAVPMEVRARAAQKLLKFSQLPFDSVFWINSGAEANENASRWRSRCVPGAPTSPQSNKAFTAARRLVPPRPGAHRRNGFSCRARRST